MSDDELLAILSDADAGLDPAVGWGEVHRYVVMLLAERDRLQQRIDANEGDLEAWEEMERAISESSLGTPEARALQDRKPQVGMAMALSAKYLARAEAAEAERNRLRLVVERAHDHVRADEAVLRTLDQDGLIALVGVLRRDHAELRADVKVQTQAADAAAEAVGNVAEYASQAVIERDRLQHVLADVFVAMYPPGGDGLVGTVEHTELPDHVHRMRTERNRLQKVVDATISYVFALDGQSEAVVARARRSYEDALAALNASEGTADE